MRKNEIYCSENEIMNSQNIKEKNPEEFIYKNIFLCPLNKNDCVNSMDIFDDILVYGTIMGNVYLCRVDENNLKSNNSKKKNNDEILKVNNNTKKEDNNNINNKKIDEYGGGNVKIDENNKNKELPKIPLIKVKKIEKKNNINNNEQDLIPIKNEIKKYENNKKPNKNNDEEKKENNKKNNISNGSNKANKEISLIRKNKILDCSSQKDDDLISIKYKNIYIEEDNIGFPQVTTLISNACENISCIVFDTKDNIIISVGDLEIIKLEKISTFNINDLNSKYDYTRVRNYPSEEEHIINCENSTCFLTPSNFLMINTVFEENNSPITMQQIPYKNKLLNNLDIIKGNIEMFNFCVPFDFDGDKFLFLDYQTKDTRRICIYYTVSKYTPFIHIINNDFGHISHMKLLYDDRIFLCRKYTQCEIYKIDENLTLLENWTHIGEEVIAVEIYISGTKISINNGKNKYNIEENIKSNENIIHDIENIQSTKRALKNEEKEIRFKISDRNYKTNILAIDYNKSNHSSFRELKYNNKWNYKKEYKEENFLSDNWSKNSFNNKNGEEIEIYNKNKLKIKNKNYYSNIADENLLKLKTNVISNNKFNNFNNLEINDEDKLSIATLDINGNFNLYTNKKNKVLFNLYKISNIEQRYKDEEFFSVGFPYFIIMNSLYYCISTDHGIFVLKKYTK